MKIEKIKINSFRSFGIDNNIINLDKINTIIGVNESGKSNLVKAMSGLDLTGINDVNFFKEENNILYQKPTFEITLMPYDFEIEKYSLLQKNTTILTINNRFDISVSGEFSNYISKNKEFQENRENVLNEANTAINRMNSNNLRENLNTTIKQIKNAENKIFINYTYIESLINSLKNYDNISEFTNSFEKCIDFLIFSNQLFPKFMPIEDLELKSKYSLSTLRDGQQSKKALIKFLKAVDMELDDLLKYWELEREDDKENFEDKLNEDINDKLVAEFNDFYGVETIKMKIRLNSNSIAFLIKSSNGKSVNYEERSNGLKWYIMLFVQMMTQIDNASDINNKIIVLDEPGVYLHVNAQKNILTLFEHLMKKGNQILYTTHLPTMIYEKRLDRIRLIFKDDKGFSRIENKYYHISNNVLNIDDTIAPIVKALGMNMNFNLLMTNRTIAIVCEGISDYNYLQAYIIQKQLNEYKIIPSTGANNIKNIISILKGWGIKSIAIFDNDKEGQRCRKEILKAGLLLENEALFIDGSCEESLSPYLIENLFSEEDTIKFGLNNNNYEISKSYYSLSVLKRIEEENDYYANETLNKFNKLFERIK